MALLGAINLKSIMSTIPPVSLSLFTFPVHWPELGVDLGLNYCHPLLTTTGPNWVWDLGLGHWHQPLPGSFTDEANLSIRLIFQLTGFFHVSWHCGRI